MYNDELDMALESAYEDGYYQALADMGYEFDDVEEDVDIFDENCFDEAMEGNKANKEARERYIATHGGRGAYRRNPDDPRGLQRRNLSATDRANREIDLKTAGANKDVYRSGYVSSGSINSPRSTSMTSSRNHMKDVAAKRLSAYGSDQYINAHRKEAGDTMSRFVHSVNRKSNNNVYLGDDGKYYRNSTIKW